MILTVAITCQHAIPWSAGAGDRAPRHLGL